MLHIRLGLFNSNGQYKSKLESNKIIKALFVICFFTTCAFLSNAWMLIHGGLLFDNYHDSIAQIIPFTYLLQQSYDAGEHFWSWSYGLGGDIFSEFTYYYTTSPFFYLQYILAKCIGVIGAPIIVYNKFRAAFCIIKQVLVMLAMYRLLRYERIDKAFSIMSSILYGCSYLFVFWYVHFDFFTDAFFWLPVTILAYGIYKKTRNWLPLLFSLAFTVGNSFYFGYNSCIFFMMFFLLFTLPEGKFDYKQYFGELFKLAGLSMLAVGVSAIAFLPSVMAMFSADRQKINVSLDLFRGTQFIKALPEILFTNYGLFCFPLVCVLIVFIDWKKCSDKLKKKTVLALLWGILLLFPFWGSVMNGFSYESDRWYYIVVFLVCYSLPEWLINIKENNRLNLLEVLIVAAITAVIFFTRASRAFPENAMTFKSLRFLPTDIIPMIMGLLAVVMLYLWQKRQAVADDHNALKIAVVAFVICANIFYTNSNSMQGLFLSAKDLVNTEIATGDPVTGEIHQLLKPKENEFFRVDNRDSQESYLAANQSCYALDYTTSAYNSLINRDLHECLKRGYDLYNPTVAPSLYLGFDDRLFLETAWGVKYKINNDYNRGIYRNAYLSNGAQVLENPLDTGLDLWYSSCTSETVAANQDYAQRDAMILQTAVIEPSLVKTLALNDTDLEEITEYKYYSLEDADMEGCRIGSGSVSVDEHAVIRFDIPQEFYNGNGEMLASVTIRESEGRQFTYSINGKQALRNADDWKWTYHLNDFSSIITNDRKHLIIELSEGEYHIDNIRVAFNSFEHVSDWVTERNRYNLEDLVVDGSRISGTIKNNEDGLIALSIPYNKGWSCRLDGRDSDLIRVNDIFTGVYLEKGEHNIEFRFFPPYLKMGLMISVASIVTALCIYYLGRMKRAERTEK